MKLDITSLTSSGQGVARHHGQVVFVAGALPGEQVQAEVVGRRRGVLEAVTRDVLTPSPWRENAPCPLAGTQCGGCDLAHVQLAFRQDAMKACLRGALRGGPPQLREAVETASFYPSPWHYRLRGTLHWQPFPPKLGFFAPRSRRVAELPECRVLSPSLWALLPLWTEALARARLLPGELAFLEDIEAQHRLALWQGKMQALPRNFPGVNGFFALRGPGWGTRKLQLQTPVPLAVPVGTFVQGNRFLLPELWGLVERLVREKGIKNVLDLYAGVGFFATAAVAGGASAVTAVEVSPLAVAAAKENLPGAQVLAARAEAVVRQGILNGKDLVIVDPPRGGLAPVVRQALTQTRCPLLFYLSCDPACLARDATVLIEAGYQVVWAKLFDLFGGTHHGELAVLFYQP